MFLRNYGALMSLARPEAMPSPQATGAAREAAQAEAYLAMSRELEGMPLSRRLTDPNARSRDRIVKKSEKDGLYTALDFGCVWLERALAGK